eukprot:CAMPEP_0201551354 /NCGR_PEP_ID=MMETSP0173_2-20130828/7541_1 /ASSEMBLY_ACC=CAM_ASM_000268 /TAXON_ID=218659 /ORGANISM="Vexillifera sp., Strain DIVA3 564/2" /LENGTH=564 /DNA_ID=CAMNT_0047961577 /DNA_START=48 /DNA_END=1742 /DNA_ORIENTATION=+
MKTNNEKVYLSPERRFISQDSDQDDLDSIESDYGLDEVKFTTSNPSNSSIVYFLKSHKLAISIVGCLVVLIVLAISLTVILTHKESASSTFPDNQDSPNVIFMIGDGYSTSVATFTRLMNGGRENSEYGFDDMVIGTVETTSSSSLVTDSAAGATAYACGVKTFNGGIGVSPGQTTKACGTLMEAAKASGRYRTGIVTTARLTHATPAAWTSHWYDRDDEYDIAQQQATLQDVDLWLGGGRKKFIDNPQGDLLSHMKEQRGYSVFTDKAGFDSIRDNDPSQLPLIGVFADSHIEWEIDRRQREPVEQPSLVEMTNKALSVLGADADEHPFFLMIEGARIDMAEHIHDQAAMYWEANQYQESANAVKAFVEKHPNTIVIGVSDHETGGLTLGAQPKEFQYPTYQWYPEVVQQQRHSSEWIRQEVQANLHDLDEVRTIIKRETGLTPDDQEFETIVYPFQADLGTRWKNEAISNFVAKHAQIGWTTAGHTGGDVNLHVWGMTLPSLHGAVQNIDVGRQLRAHLNLDQLVESITQQLEDFDVGGNGDGHNEPPTKRSLKDYDYYIHD